VVVLSGTDHFFWKREREVAELIGVFAERAFFGERAKSNAHEGDRADSGA
jgi:hypothetical protein